MTQIFRRLINKVDLECLKGLEGFKASIVTSSVGQFRWRWKDQTVRSVESDG